MSEVDPKRLRLYAIMLKDPKNDFDFVANFMHILPNVEERELEQGEGRKKMNDTEIIAFDITIDEKIDKPRSRMWKNCVGYIYPKPNVEMPEIREILEGTVFKMCEYRETGTKRYARREGKIKRGRRMRGIETNKPYRSVYSVEIAWGEKGMDEEKWIHAMNELEDVVKVNLLGVSSNLEAGWTLSGVQESLAWIRMLETKMYSLPGVGLEIEFFVTSTDVEPGERVLLSESGE